MVPLRALLLNGRQQPVCLELNIPSAQFRDVCRGYTKQSDTRRLEKKGNMSMFSIERKHIRLYVDVSCGVCGQGQ